LTFYRQLLAVRKSSPALQIGDYRSLDHTPDECYAYLRTLTGEPSFLVAINFSAQELNLEYPALNGGNVILSTYLDRGELVREGKLTLRAYEGALVKLSSV
jgi:glycosidase